MSGFFGGQKVQLLDDYKEPKADLFTEYKRVLEGFVPSSDLLVPLFQWFSNCRENIRNICFINEKFFFVKKEILSRYLVLNINRQKRFIKYPKKSKEAKEEEVAFLIPYILRLYGWSEREFEIHRHLIDLYDPELHQLLHKKFGLEPKECRKLGLKVPKIKAKYEGQPRVRGFF